MIEGVVIKDLKIFSDERGKVMHMLRSDDVLFKQFGEVYFSIVNPGAVKGWKKHLKMTQHFAVPIGNIKLVLYDDRENSSTKSKIQEIFIGTENYQLLQIPFLVWYSFKSVSNEFALIANCTDFLYDPKEVINTDPFDKRIPYNWSLGR